MSWWNARPHPCPLPRGEGESPAARLRIQRRWVVRVSRRSIAKRKAPAGATSDLRKTQDANSLALRERARVRGNETPPTKTAGRILQAQRELLRKSELATTSSEKPVVGRRARGRKRIGVSSVPSPSPRPLPWGEGESPAAAWRIECAASCRCLGVESRSTRCQRERRPT